MFLKIKTKEIQDIIGFTPHDAQQKIIDGMKRFTVICAGTRFGKSKLCAYLVLLKILEAMLDMKGKRIWVVAPTYDLSKKVFTYLASFVGKLYPEKIQKREIVISDRSGSTKVDFRYCNSWVEFKSADNKTSLLGEELDMIIVDECSRLDSDVWDSYLSGRLTSRRGSAVFISTPFGKNWFWQLYEKTKALADGAVFQFPSNANPYFPQEEWEREKANRPEQSFKQEHMAVFLEDAASVFRNIRENIWGEFQLPEPKHFYSLGVDLARIEDFTVICVIDENTHHLVYFDRFKEIDWNLQKGRIIETAKKYNNAVVVVDSTGIGDPISEDLKNAKLRVEDFKFTNTSKQQLIDKLSLFIEQNRITYPNIEQLIDELESFGYIRTDSGHYKYSAPQGVHDDCVYALALAVWRLWDNPRKKLKDEDRPIILKPISKITGY